MKLSPWLVLLCLTLASCSGSKSAQNVDQDTPQIELSDADEFTGGSELGAEYASEAGGDESNIGLADLGTESVDSASSLEGGSSYAMADESATMDTTDFGSVQAVSDAPTFEPSSAGGAERTYTVRKNETLMLISFKLYGDYERWREIARQNRDTLAGGNQLREGMVLRYRAPAREFVWNPSGQPYLIRTGDSLSKISGNVYNDIRKWKLIWNNNKPLIKDPNKIFAGFTIYYLENGREVASEL
jgi:nucleoid-associated protein YgaU